jgi:hypothetical protein
MATRPGDLAAARIVGERFVYSQRRQNPGGRVPLTDHLRELRNCVVTMALALAAGMAVGSVFFCRPGALSSARCAGRDPRAFGLPGAGGRPAGPGWPARRVLPAGKGRASRRVIVSAPICCTRSDPRAVLQVAAGLTCGKDWARSSPTLRSKSCTPSGSCTGTSSTTRTRTRGAVNGCVINLTTRWHGQAKVVLRSWQHPGPIGLGPECHAGPAHWPAGRRHRGPMSHPAVPYRTSRL